MADIRSIAFRRAGHAIACLEFGAPLQPIDLDVEPDLDDEVPDGRSSYASSTVGNPRSRERAHGEIEVRISLAGGIAQRRSASQGASLEEDEDALERAREIIWYLVGGWDEDSTDGPNGAREESAAYLSLLRIQTERLIARRWRQIEAIAAALIRHRRLTGIQLRDLATGLRQGFNL